MKCRETKEEDDKLEQKKGSVYGYVRVSTDLQDVGKQRDTIERWYRREGFGVKDIRMIVAGEISSSKSKRARKLDFLGELREGDVLICSELSRLSRTTMELLGIVDDLLRKKVRIVFVQHNLDLKDLSCPLTKIALHMFSVFAETERDRISQRTKEALRVLKERGIKLGKPKGSIQHSILERYRNKIMEWCKMGVSYRCQANALKVSHSTLIH